MAVIQPIQKLYRVRWAFYYGDGRYSYGLWDMQPAGEFRYHADKQPRDGLERVEIQSQSMIGRITKTEFSVPAERFKQFKWIVTGGAAGGPMLAQVIQLPTTYLGGQIELIDGKICRFCINGDRKET